MELKDKNINLLKFRKANISDKDGLKKLGILSYSQFKNVLTENSWLKMNSFLNSDKSYFDLLDISQCFVCENKNEIIGMAFLVPKGNPTEIFDKDWSYIRMVGVNPKYIGNGIGKQLTNMCIEFARENNERIIALHTSEFMNSARHIYESLGFKQIKEIKPIFEKKYWLYQLEL